MHGFLQRDHLLLQITWFSVHDSYGKIYTKSVQKSCDSYWWSHGYYYAEWVRHLPMPIEAFGIICLQTSVVCYRRQHFGYLNENLTYFVRRCLEKLWPIVALSKIFNEYTKVNERACPLIDLILWSSFCGILWHMVAYIHISYFSNLVAFVALAKKYETKILKWLDLVIMLLVIIAWGRIVVSPLNLW